MKHLTKIIKQKKNLIVSFTYSETLNNEYIGRIDQMSS